MGTSPWRTQATTGWAQCAPSPWGTLKVLTTQHFSVYVHATTAAQGPRTRAHRLRQPARRFDGSALAISRSVPLVEPADLGFGDLQGLAQL